MESEASGIPARREQQPYGPYAVIDPRRFVCRGPYELMSMAEFGAMWRELNRRMLYGPPPTTEEFPFVVRFHPGRTKRSGRTKPPAALREAVLSVGSCLHCGRADDLTLDHIVPYSKGGPTVQANLQCLCRSCNSRKGVR